MKDDKEKILKSSFEIFTSKGIEQTTLQDIAADVGISMRRLLYNFPSKDDLLYKMFDTCILDLAKTTKVFVVENQGENSQQIIELTTDQLLMHDFLMKLYHYLKQQVPVENQPIIQKFIMLKSKVRLQSDNCV